MMEIATISSSYNEETCTYNISVVQKNEDGTIARFFSVPCKHAETTVVAFAIASTLNANGILVNGTIGTKNNQLGAEHRYVLDMPEAAAASENEKVAIAAAYEHAKANKLQLSNEQIVEAAKAMYSARVASRGIMANPRAAGVAAIVPFIRAVKKEAKRG